MLRCPQTHTTKLLDAKTGRLREHNQCSSTRWSFLEIFVLCHWQRVSPVFQESESCFQGLKQPDPINREQESRLISIQRPKRWFRILLSCVKLKFVSCTSNSSAQMYDFQKMHNVPPEVDFESSTSPAKSESWNSPSLHYFAVLPT